MSAILPAGYANAAWIFSSTYGTAPFVFTIGVDFTAGVEDAVATANGLFEAWNDSFQSDLSEAVTLDKVSLTIGQGGDITASVDSDLPAETGTRTGDNDPIALALLVNKKTATPGRRGRGRMFIPGVLAGSDTGLNGDLTPSAQSKHNANVNSFRGGIEAALLGDGAQMVLLHSVEGVTPSPISNLTIAPKIGVLRKRLR